MEKLNVKEIVISSVKEYLETQDINSAVSKDTFLIGEKAVVDSIGLVNIIVDIESKLLDQGVEISLLSDKALSMKHSPFLNLSTLTEFIEQQI